MKTKLYNYNYFNYKFYRTSSKINLTVADDLHDLIIGLILGDLTVEKPNKNCNTRLQFKQSCINKQYIDHLFCLFKNYCGTQPRHLFYYDSRINRSKQYNSIKFQTLSLPCFNIYRDLFYNSKGKKILPNNIEQLLTPKGLAYWFMDDGYKAEKGLYICTESFSLDEIKLLIYILKNKFGLISSYHKVTNGYRLYIFSVSKEKFVEIVKPYFLQHFYYKLGLYI